MRSRVAGDMRGGGGEVKMLGIILFLQHSNYFKNRDDVYG
jgi:hypothetical protein